MDEHTAAAVYIKLRAENHWTLKATLVNEDRPRIENDADFLGQNLVGQQDDYAVLVVEGEPFVVFADIVGETELRSGAVLQLAQAVAQETALRAEHLGRLS